ncbi:MAG: TlpA disulfide reductase family protein [Candidatus Omnitrophota bacterium]|jgi:cytochrome c biogenesis protein CcmG/thiol:disulfide interchange protein DsbE
MRPGKIFIFALALLVLGACSKGNAVEIGANAPDFSLSDTNGKTVSLSEFKGKVVILDFFASWCPPCKQEIPDFIELERTYGGKDFSVIGVALVSADEAGEFAGKMGINYPVLVDDGKVSELYGPIRSIPTTFIIDKSGRIVKMYIGFRPKDIFEADIKGLLK